MSSQKLPPTGPRQKFSRLEGIRYVPLVILVVIVAIVAIVGQVALGRGSVRTSPHSDPAVATKSTPILAQQCRLPVPQASEEPWSGAAEAKARATEIWSTHAAALSKPYVLEKDGWTDWGDLQAANFSQAVGKRFLSADEAKSWHTYLSKLKSGLAGLNIPFYIVVSPAKWDVYPDVLPDWAQEIRGSDSLDRLMTSYPDLPIVDVRNPLRAASASNQTYSKTNSHWTDYGAWVAWKSISGCIAASDPALSGISALPIDGVQVSADHNEFAPYGIDNPAPNWTSPTYAAPLSEVTVARKDGSSSTVPGDTQTDMLSLPVTTVNPKAQIQSSALLVRDSFGNALSVPLQQSFARTWQVRHNFDGPAKTQPDILALAREHHPDVVILQVAERHLNFIPAP